MARDLSSNGISKCRTLSMVASSASRAVTCRSNRGGEAGKRRRMPQQEFVEVVAKSPSVLRQDRTRRRDAHVGAAVAEQRCRTRVVAESEQGAARGFAAELVLRSEIAPEFRRDA